MSELYCPLPAKDQDIFRFRYHYGINLGSVFLHGPWPSNSSTSEKDSDGLDELQALKKSVASHGLEQTRLKWETPWHPALTEDNLVWLKDVARCNTIRIPLGFFSLGPLFCLETAFDGPPSQVYASCWNIVRHLIEKCRDFGIGVLIDFHTSGGGINLDASAEGRAVAKDCIAFLAQEVTFHAMSGVVGLQISSGNDYNADLQEWYDEVLMITSAIDRSLPIYINDGREQTKQRVFEDCTDSREQFKTGATSIPSYLTIPQAEVREKAKKAKAEQPQLREKILSQLSDSWNSHQRESFSHGWDLGYSDALQFFSAAVLGVLPDRAGADKIDSLELWIRQRKTDLVPEQLSEDPTAWETGLRRGISDFYKAVQI
ncbi:hypothetical protein BO71DRAFT_352122 [Aspergillus ellipticus CBS 707.79]|uniref:Glycoside hydrolase family 5 domain-containing protein n=1 Tax=Aspergillus ellipticus CBS 707.79 TaxID=1448320 RepID=A0A319E339_9EURO|nr:hypothetical protein BO71DRAFT_352122 [Aspergillus ellipticus CBS 707.79]